MKSKPNKHDKTQNKPVKNLIKQQESSPINSDDQDDQLLQDQAGDQDQGNYQKNSSNSKAKGKTRQDNSLSVLTRKFVELIKKSQNNTIDLNEAVKILSVQKRRIYDITNVLQGIGYVQKLHKNKIKWVGSTEDPQMERQINQMKEKLNQLSLQQKKIDQYIQTLNKKIKQEFLQNQAEKQYNYLTYDDCKRLSQIIHKQSSDSLFLITAPKGTTLQVPPVQKQSQYPHQLIMNSTQGQIQIYLCEHSKYPVVYQTKIE